MAADPQSDLSQRFDRLTAYAFALEELLIAAVRSMPNRDAIVRTVVEEGEALDALALGEPFSDDYLAEMGEARKRLLAIVAPTGEQTPVCGRQRRTA